ncbi:MULTISPECIES: hypothetical protein [Flavobacterium]|uniref:Bacteriocin-type signal sequence-containing protein n=1 Tax=Flavobacterium keumense TaxID=1306518 RepID=A0ABY8N4I7_9FLAO|nr:MULTISPECIES: hypothetical protein [Flavobacterium]WGK94553.1 hypothetical protein MG292_10790 [Flavobacterium keumense]
MKNLELNPEFNLLGQIDLNSVKIALDRDEMEEIVGGYRNSGGKTVIYGIGAGCFVAGMAGIAASVFTFGAGTVFGITLAGAFCTGAGAGALAYEMTH